MSPPLMCPHCGRAYRESGHRAEHVRMFHGLEAQLSAYDRQLVLKRWGWLVLGMLATAGLVALAFLAASYY